MSRPSGATAAAPPWATRWSITRSGMSTRWCATIAAAASSARPTATATDHPGGVMTPETVEAFCLTLPGAVMSVQWGGAHVLKVGGKIFTILAGMSRGEPEAWFKASEFSYILLVEQPGIRPAPYLA